jgi:hypothetical protein
MTATSLSFDRQARGAVWATGLFMIALTLMTIFADSTPAGVSPEWIDKTPTLRPLLGFMYTTLHSVAFPWVYGGLLLIGALGLRARQEWGRQGLVVLLGFGTVVYAALALLILIGVIPPQRSSFALSIAERLYLGLVLAWFVRNLMSAGVRAECAG